MKTSTDIHKHAHPHTSNMSIIIHAQTKRYQNCIDLRVHGLITLDNNLEFVCSSMFHLFEALLSSQEKKYIFKFLALNAIKPH